MKKNLALMLATCLLVLPLAACGGTQPSEASTASAGEAATAYSGDLEPYTIKWYFMGSAQPDVAAVEAEINKITQEKINTTVELYFVDYGSYDEKMRIALASGDDIDMCFTSNFTNDYISNASKGAFAEITMEQLEALAPNMLAAVPAEAWGHQGRLQNIRPAN